MSPLKFRAFDKATNTMLVTGFRIFGEVTCFDIVGQKLAESAVKGSTLERINDVVVMHNSPASQIRRVKKFMRGML